MTKYKLRGTESDRTGDVHLWITRDEQPMDLEEIVADLMEQQREVERLKRLLGRDNPVECPVCGQIREASEMHCGQCTYRLDVSDGGDE